MLTKQHKFNEAAEMFSKALGYPFAGCDRVRILMSRAKALAASSSREKALGTLRETEIASKNCDSRTPDIPLDMADLYMGLGQFKEALSSYQRALTLEKEETNQIALKLKEAQCYWALDKKEDSLRIYDQLSTINDPFWSALAKEKRDEIQFHKELSTKH
jgi:tetratricopeptide (TPR) repeat protein